jgi:hypothetical protein
MNASKRGKDIVLIDESGQCRTPSSYALRIIAGIWNRNGSGRSVSLKPARALVAAATTKRLTLPPPRLVAFPAGHASYTTLRKQALVTDLQLRHRDIRALDPAVQLPCEP